MAKRPLPIFDPSGPALEVSIRWAKWKRGFEYYVESEGVTDKKRMRNKLLHLAGLAVQDIFDTLPTPAVPVDGTPLADYDEAIAMLDKYFAHTPNITFERHTFRRMAQKPEETVAQFVNRLEQQAKLCSFDNKSAQIMDQLVEKIVDDRLRKKFWRRRGRSILLL